MDASIQGEEPENDSDDLPVSVTTLEIDGVRPKVGDKVDLKVTGTIRKLVDETAFVVPETVNDQPMPAEAQTTEKEDLMAQAQSMDASTPFV
jgi:hypothetical protein